MREVTAYAIDERELLKFVNKKIRHAFYKGVIATLVARKLVNSQGTADAVRETREWIENLFNKK